MHSRTLRILKEVAPVLTAALLGVLLIGPATAQFFPFFGNDRSAPRQQRGGGGFGGFFGDDGPYFQPFQRAPRRAPVVREDASRAPAPEKRDTAAERNVVVLGDAMADWLAYGLEDAYSERNEIGVVRRHKAGSGLIRYQARGEPSEWTTAAKNILAQDRADVIVVMLGLNDRGALREQAKAADRPGDKKDPRKPADSGKKLDDRPDADVPDDSAEIADPAPIMAPDKPAKAADAYEFRDDKWVELYAKKIDEFAAVLKTKGVPIVWVGPPAIRGTKATADMLFLNGLYREAAARDGFTYVDVWDGFVDEAGRYVPQGPDFEGQTRRLRSADGVYFSRAGARKLAHYAEREISRLLASRSAPTEIPAEPVPEAEAKPEAKPGGPPPRPLAGPIVPLTAAVVNTDQLLGGPGARPPTGDSLAMRTLVRGEPLSAPAGRADDVAWPRREVGREQAPQGGDMPMALRGSEATVQASAPQAAAPKPKRPRPIRQAQQPSGGFDFFGGDPARSRGQQRGAAQSSGLFDFFR